MQRTRAFHPILLAIYLVLFTYAHNFEFAPPAGEIVELLAFAVGGVALLWGLLFLVTRDRLKSAISASGLVLLFVSYGHLKNLITAWSWGFQVFSFQLGFIKLSVSILVILAAAAAAWVRRASPAAMQTATAACNAAAIFLVAFNSAHLFTVEGRAHAAQRHNVATQPSRLSTVSASGVDQPDIYYIILDTYGRSDVLEDLYGYDNRDFIEWLTNKGFYVADKSRSNYSQTMLSLASSLNLTYLDPVALSSAAAEERTGRMPVKFNWAAAELFASPMENQRLPLALMIQNSQAVARLKDRGYRFVAFTSGYGGVQFPGADVVRRASVMSDFEESMVGTTPLPDVFYGIFDQRQLQRRRVSYVFDHLGERLDIKDPVFVFAHIMSPHSPFVFEADGSPAPRRSSAPADWYDDAIDQASADQRQSFVQGYRGQIAFVNRQIRRVLESLLADTTRRRIIIIQGDHGPNMMMKVSDPAGRAAAAERLPILNAYYVPPDIRGRLYPSITPVNTFRVILNRYAGGSDALLPDRSYMSPHALYDFVDKTAELSALAEARCASATETCSRR